MINEKWIIMRSFQVFIVLVLSFGKIFNGENWISFNRRKFTAHINADPDYMYYDTQDYNAFPEPPPDSPPDNNEVVTVAPVLNPTCSK